VEPITVILQTYKRTDVALRTIAAARELLHYGGDLRWYVADDGSPAEHWFAVMNAMPHATAFHSKRRGYGANANAAWDAADSALTFWLEDDFELRAPLDLTPHAYALMDCPELGMVRLGYIDGARLEPSRMFAGRPYHTMTRDWPDNAFYAFTGHPSLRHRRYRQAYGDYPTGLTPGETELHYAYQYRVGDGSLIVWPEGYPEQGFFAHIGNIKTETML
jgi:glycosyl transferase family 2